MKPRARRRLRMILWSIKCRRCRQKTLTIVGEQIVCSYCGAAGEDAMPQKD